MLEMVSGLGNLSKRVLSDFERGRKTAEIGKILKALRTLGPRSSSSRAGPADHKTLGRVNTA